MHLILLLGKNGMLGQAITEQFKVPACADLPARVRTQAGASAGRQSSKSKVISWNRQDLDISQKSQVFKKIGDLKPDVVINATGYTDVDGAESDRQTAFKVNADGVGYIAEACSQIGAHLIHFSTDYVFDGSWAQGYKEDDLEHLGSLNVYGESKLQGEILIQTQNSKLKISKYFIIRTSWLYGSGGKNFVEAMLKRARSGQTEFKVVNDQWGFPTYTVDLAERVLWMVDRVDQLESGIYHCTNAEKKGSEPQRGSEPFHPAGITWHQFSREIFRQARGLGILSKLPIIKPCISDEFPRPAIRPKYGALINAKLPEMREWREALKEFLISNF